MPENIRDINSSRPFANTAHEYFEKGWTDPFPVKPDEKHGNIPLGFTGREAKGVTVQQINKWIKQYPHNSNIGLHMADIKIGKKVYQVIGIDVDDYDEIDSDGNVKVKSGYDQLIRLERRLKKKLPPTWISTSREDGQSGIRFFLVEKKGKGYLFRGKADRHIDIIQFIHRYAIVYPSKHPEGRWYRWTNNFPIKLGTDSREPEVKNQIPKPEDLPILPEEWVEFLTNGYVEFTDQPMEMDLTVSQLDLWAKKRFAPMRKMCPKMEEQLEFWKAAIDEDATSHDKIRDGHWNLLRMGSPMEGHSGWSTAIKELERYWSEDVGPKRNKRSMDEIREEVFRSRANALRKAKGEIDALEERTDRKLAKAKCACFVEEEFKPSAGTPKPTGKALKPLEYPPDHDGTAQHFNDLYKGDIHWVESEKSWYLWDGNRWQKDTDGLVYRMFWAVRDRLRKHAHHLTVNLAATGQPDKSQDPDGADVWKAKDNKAKEYTKWSKALGMKTNREASILHAQAIEEVSVIREMFDQNRHLLGVANGVVELKMDGSFEHRPAKHEDMITLSTGIPYVPLQDQLKKGGEVAEGVNLLIQYLDRFMPDPVKRKFLRAALASSLYGYNLDKKMFFCIGDTNTGKSTILELVSAAMGEYAGPPGPGIYEKKESGLTPALSRAFQRRFLVSSEIEEDQRMDASRLKELTGNDSIASENKGSNVIVEDIVAFTMWMSSNGAPRINGMDDAMRQRIYAIPFTEQVSGADKDSSATAEMKRLSKMACLAWMIEGWKDYRKLGSFDKENVPQEVLEATDLFFTEMSPVGLWAQENLKEKRGGYEEPNDLFAKYLTYARNTMRIPENELLREIQFTKELSAMGWRKQPKRIGGKSRRVWVGMEYTGFTTKGWKPQHT